MWQESPCQEPYKLCCHLASTVLKSDAETNQRPLRILDPVLGGLPVLQTDSGLIGQAVPQQQIDHSGDYQESKVARQVGPEMKNGKCLKEEIEGPADSKQQCSCSYQTDTEQQLPAPPVKEFAHPVG